MLVSHYSPTGYELDGLGIECRWGGKIFCTCPEWPWGPISLLYNGYRVFPRGSHYSLTGYGLDSPGNESRWGGEIFRTCPDRPWCPPSLLYNGYRVFPRGKERPEHDVDPPPPSSAMVMKEQSYTSTPLMGRTACTEPQCLYKSALYLYIYL